MSVRIAITGNLEGMTREEAASSIPHWCAG